MIKPLKVSDVPRILSYMWRAKGIPWIKRECKPIVLYQSCLCVTLYGLVILSSIVFEPFVITIRLFLCHVVFCGWNPCHSFSSDKLNILFHLNIPFLQNMAGNNGIVSCSIYFLYFRTPCNHVMETYVSYANRNYGSRASSIFICTRMMSKVVKG